MKGVIKFALGAALVALGGCATIVKGTTQDIAVDTNPEGASCNVSRGGAQMALVNPTPGIVKVSRSKDPLTFSCSKPPEYPNAAVVTVESSFNGATAGNVLIGGLLGIAVDASTGANYSYPDKVSIDIMAANAPPPDAVAPAPEPAKADPPPNAPKPPSAAPTKKPDPAPTASPPVASN